MIDEANITKRLDILIRLLLEQQLQEGKMKRGEQLALLDSVGLTPTEIGKVLGQASKDISSQLIRIRKKKSTKGKKNETN